MSLITTGSAFLGASVLYLLLFTNQDYVALRNFAQNAMVGTSLLLYGHLLRWHGEKRKKQLKEKQDTLSDQSDQSS